MNEWIALATSLGSRILLVDHGDSDSESDDEVVTYFLCVQRFKKTPQRVESYVELTLENFTTKQFQQNFRVTVEKYELLLSMLGPSLTNKSGRSTVSTEKQLLAVLWILATPDSYRSIGERFNMAKSTLSVCFMRVIKLFCKVASVIIKWPDQNRKMRSEEKFRNMAHLPHVIGAVDGTFINMKAPKKDPEVYVTRKCSYAVTLQAICDSELKFIDVFAGYPGSVNDNRIFRNSPIFERIRNNQDNYITDDEYILGDKAYPLLQWCIPPYVNRGDLTPAKIYFNQQHSKTRQVIERAFALLFGRFRRLKYLDMNRTDFIPAAILAACIIHNLCIKTEVDDEFIREGLQHLAQENIDNIEANMEENVGEDNIHIFVSLRELQYKREIPYVQIFTFKEEIGKEDN